MPFRTRFSRSLLVLLTFVGFACAAPALRAQDDDSKPERHGRKYKAPPETSQVHVIVVKGFNKKPIDGAHVIMHPMNNGGLDEGGLEFKTHQDGSISTDVIPTGSTVMIQVLADGFATYAKDYVIDQPNQEITIAMERPKAQVSTYMDNADKPAQRQPGVQEPVRPKKPATSGASSSSNPSTNNSSGTKPQN
jgi:hypothetical protein